MATNPYSIYDTTAVANPVAPPPPGGAPAPPPAPAPGAAPAPPPAPNPAGTAGSAATAAGPLAAWAMNPTTMTVQQLGQMAGPMQGPTTYQPSENALVSRQLTNLLSQDNPYMQRARTRAMQYSNSRGLLNSSMAAGAGEAAAIDAALPIAQQDAGSYFTADRENAAAQNTFARDANQFGREGALSIFREGSAFGRQRDQQDFQRGENTAEREFRRGENVLDRQFRREDREDTQDFESAERQLDRTFSREERVAVQDFEAAQAEIGRQFSRDERLSSQDWQSLEARLGREFTTAEREAVEQWRTTEAAKDRRFARNERLDSQNFTLMRDAQQFENRLKEIDAQTASQIEIYDRQNGTNLMGSYNTAVRTIYDQYAADAQRIQEADLDPDVKEAQLENLQRLAVSRVEFTNNVYRYMPGWSDEWAQQGFNFEEVDA